MIQSAALLIALITPTLAESGDWPQWRGPNRDGIALSANLPGKWPTTLSAPLWSKPVGVGYSSPVISGGRVFVMGRDEGKVETCLCFDAKSGNQIWKRAYESDYEPPDPRAGPGPKSTPTVDGDRVYMIGLGGMFHCLDATTGGVLWKHDLRKEYWSTEKDMDGVDSWFPPCGYTASVLVLGDEVIVPVGGKKVGAIASFDRKTGKVLWHVLPERSSYGSPILASPAGIRQVIGFSGLRMAGIDLTKHTVMWDAPYAAFMEQTITTPVVHKDLVIVSGEQKPTFALKIAKEAGKVTATRTWQNPDLRAYMTSPVVFGDHMVGADSAGKRLVCVDLAKGETKWTSPKILGHISLILAGDRILVLSSKGEITIVKADAAAYTELGKWTVSQAGEAWSYPALANGKLYVKDKENLICYSLAGS